MVRKLGRITIISLALLLLFWASAAFSEINEDMMSEIITGKSSDTSDTVAETTAVSPPDPIPDTKNPATTVKETLPPTPQDQAIIHYTKGLEALERNQEVEAATLFKKSLEEYPKYHKSRIQLIQLYQKIGWADEVEKLLLIGLDFDPEHSDFIKNLALLYQQKGQMRKSLSILLTMPDNQSNQTDYIALLALAYLNSDQYDIAEKYYQQLLTFNKENSTWWLGLAISQNANGNYKDAVESFNQAKVLGRFNNETLDYIHNKTEEIRQY